MYELANSILEERRRDAERRRLISALRRLGKGSNSDISIEPAATLDQPWTLEWTTNGFTGKRVRLTNELTGERPTGRDPSDWDRAMGEAVRELEMTA